MNKELTLLERREIARKTIGTKKIEKDKLQGWKFQGWTLLVAMTHKHETYDFFKIPRYESEVQEYYKNNPIIFDTDRGILVKYIKQNNKKL